MSNTKLLIDKISSLKGAKFIGLNSYGNAYGEVANYVINTNLNGKAIKERNLATLQAHNSNDIAKIASKFGVEPIKAQSILDGLIEKAIQNLSENKEERTNQSQAQTDAYIVINSSLKLHKETLDLHIVGVKHSKKVLIEGEYPATTSNKGLDTKIKDEFRKNFAEQRTFKVSNLERAKISGDTIDL